MSKEENTSKNKKKHHRSHHYTVIPYILTPIIFVLIAMIVVIPVSISGMNFAVDTVHKAQLTLVKDYNDIEAETEYEGSDKSSGIVEIPRLSTASKIGEIVCRNAGLNADVFYGINRVSLRNGVALEADGSKCGMGGNINVYGYASSGFKSLDNVESGDYIEFETLWGTYKYKVVTKSVLPNAPDISSKETLVLATSRDSKAFSAFDKSKLYVVAEKVSGPDAEEVAQ